MADHDCATCQTKIGCF